MEPIVGVHFSSCLSYVLTLEVEFAMRQILVVMASMENLAAWFT